MNGNEFFATPPRVTVTAPSPGAAPVGICALMLPSLQLVTNAFAPLKTRFPAADDWDDPNPDPVIVTDAPETPELTDMPDGFAGGITKKAVPALDM